MKLEDAMAQLRAHEEPRANRHSDGELLALVKRQSDEFDRTIRRRDRREVIAAALVFAFFSIVLVDGSWLTRFGALIVMAGCVSTYLQSRRARMRQAGSADQSLVETLRTERARVDAQVRLLRRVLRWYIAPFAVGAVLAFVGAAGATWPSVIYTLAVAAISAGIYHLNQLAVRGALVPRRHELDRMLRDLEG